MLFKPDVGIGQAISGTYRRFPFGGDTAPKPAHRVYVSPFTLPAWISQLINNSDTSWAICSTFWEMLPRK
jgi:hypothetical protein